MIFRVGAERSRRRNVHKVHDCDENREGNPPTLLRATDGQANPENSAVKGIFDPFYSLGGILSWICCLI
ncbi:MAG: hypothetical protein U1E78_08810 [Gammaproteobacteria bacterium]